MAAIVTHNSLFAFALIVALSILSLLVSYHVRAENGFSADLIHRDSLGSPFYDPLATSHQCTANALQRSFDRIGHFILDSILPTSAESYLISSASILWSYLSVRLRSRTWPQQTQVLIDKGVSSIVRIFALSVFQFFFVFFLLFSFKTTLKNYNCTPYFHIFCVLPLKIY